MQCTLCSRVGGKAAPERVRLGMSLLFQEGKLLGRLRVTFQKLIQLLLRFLLVLVVQVLDQGNSLMIGKVD